MPFLTKVTKAIPVALNIDKDEEPKDKIKQIDAIFLKKIREENPKFTNKDVTDFIKNKISYINEVDDF